MLFRSYEFKDIHCTRIAEGIAYPDLHTFGSDETQEGESYTKDENSGQPKSLAVTQSLHSTLPFHKNTHNAPKYSPEYRLYNAMDCVVLPEILPKQLAKIERDGNTHAYESQRALLRASVFNSAFGIRMPPDALPTLRTHLDNQFIVTRQRVRNHIGNQEYNPNSVQQKRALFYGDKHSTKSTDEKHLLKLQQSTNAFISKAATLHLAFGKLKTARNTYSKMRLLNGRFVYALDPIGTRFGRPSSRQFLIYGGNAQNQNEVTKSLMLPEEGYVLYKADGAQAEARVIANEANEPQMLEIFAKGLDFHSEIFSIMYNMPASEARTYYPPVGMGRHSGRYICKRVGHGKNYGLTGYGIAVQLGIPSAHGKKLDKLHTAKFPRMGEWRKELETQYYRKGRRFITCLGRTYTFYHSPWRRVMNNVLAYMGQSPVGDLTNGVYTWVLDDVECAIISLLEHDGFYFQLPESIGWSAHAEILTQVRARMERTLTCVNGNEFSIPCDLTMCTKNFNTKDKTQAIELESIAPTYLDSTYERAQVHIPS